MLPPVAPATVVEACVWDLRVGDKGVPAGLVLSRCASAAGGRELQQPLWAGGDTVTLGTWSKNSTPTVRLPPWTSPSTPGAYVATWVLTTSDGVRCGPLLQLAVDVSEDAVAQFVVDGDRQVCTAGIRIQYGDVSSDLLRRFLHGVPRYVDRVGGQLPANLQSDPSTRSNSRRARGPSTASSERPT